MYECSQFYIELTSLSLSFSLSFQQILNLFGTNFALKKLSNSISTIYLTATLALQTSSPNIARNNSERNCSPEILDILVLIATAVSIIYG